MTTWREDGRFSAGIPSDSAESPGGTCDTAAVPDPKRAEAERLFKELCQKGKHPLEVIKAGGPDIDGWQVVWCQVCGAVASDATADGRVSPGAHMRMRVPKLSSFRG